MTLYISQLHPITVYRTGFGCALFWSWMSLCLPSINFLIEFYFIAIIVTILGFLSPSFLLWTTCLDFLKQNSSGSAKAYVRRCFHHWTFPLKIKINMLHSDPFMSCLNSLLGYSTREFQALQLFSLGCLVSGINHLPPVSWSTFGDSVWNDSGFVSLA